MLKNTAKDKSIARAATSEEVFSITIMLMQRSVIFPKKTIFFFVTSNFLLDDDFAK